MGIDGITLKNHGHVSLPGIKIVDQPAVNPNLPAADRIQADDHIEQGRFAAAGRAEQNKEFTIRYGKGNILHGLRAVGKFFADISN